MIPQLPGPCRLKDEYIIKRHPLDEPCYPVAPDGDLHGGYRYVQPDPGKRNKLPCIFRNQTE